MIITNTSEPVYDYAKRLGECETLAHLNALLAEYEPIVKDAMDAAPKSDAEFDEFMAGLRKERKGEFAGVEHADRYGAILMPEIMIRAIMVADHYKVPWGLAFNRLVDAGKIIKGRDGVYSMVQS